MESGEISFIGVCRPKVGLLWRCVDACRTCPLRQDDIWCRKISHHKSMSWRTKYIHPFLSKLRMERSTVLIWPSVSLDEKIFKRFFLFEQIFQFNRNPRSPEAFESEILCVNHSDLVSVFTLSIQYFFEGLVFDSTSYFLLGLECLLFHWDSSTILLIGITV